MGDFTACTDQREEVRVIVRSLAGRELPMSLAPDALVREVKDHVKASWGIPVMEQKLVLMGSILNNKDKLAQHAACDDLDVMLVRGSAFHFDKSLAHPRAKLGEDSAVIEHGGQWEYQAAFLSDILDKEGTYSVRFKLQDAGHRQFQEMYVGVAPDAHRDWSNLKGAYINRLGIYIDAFHHPGWLHDSSTRIRSLFTQRICTAFKAMLNPQEGEESPESCEFILEVDMPGCKLRFVSVQGEQVATVTLPELASEPVRLCATLGHPKQTVSIIDA